MAVRCGQATGAAKGSGEMGMSGFDEERYSLCIVHAESNTGKTYYKYYRVADYVTQGDSGELVPAIVQKDAVSLEEAGENPDHLYNPAAARNHDSRESDFFLFQWKRDPYDWGRQLTRSCYDEESLLDIEEAREVIILEGRQGEQGLRNALSEGIPFEGKTTSVFYIAYAREGDCRLAVRCERRDFSFTEDGIRLRDNIGNPRGTVLSVPRVRLRDYDIIESPHGATSYRKVYAKLGELRFEGNVPLRSLDYYAADYVKWFIREESVQVSKSERRAVAQIIDQALSRPDALEAYLGTGVQEEEVENLRNAIASLVMEKKDSDRELFREALLKDEGFRRECLDQVMHSVDVELEERKAELATVEHDVVSAHNQLSDLENDIEGLSCEKRQLENDISDLTMSMGRLRGEEQALLEKLQSDVALKLGLKAVAAQSSAAHRPAISIEDGWGYDVSESDAGFVEAFSFNMKQLGIVSAVGCSADDRRRLAVGLVAAFAATKVLAMPQAVARRIADSLSVAMTGRKAKRLIVPADFRDFPVVLDELSAEDAVVVVDGVIDAVNEGILFALLEADAKPVIILPFVSHASACLIAREAWGKMYLPNVEGFLAYSCPSKTVKLRRAVSEPASPVVGIDDALDEIKDLGGELEQLGLGMDHLLLAATVLRAVEKLTDEDLIERYVVQHLLMCSRRDESAFRLSMDWADGDAGLIELSKKLGIYGQ